MAIDPKADSNTAIKHNPHGDCTVQNPTTVVVAFSITNPDPAPDQGSTNNVAPPPVPPN